MKIFKRAAAAALAAVTMLTFTGCWDYREVEDLILVSGMAVDEGTEGHKYRLTLELLDLTDGSGSVGAQKSELLTAEGDTLADAAANASLSAENELYFNDCKVIIFSSKIAQAGLNTVMDWLNRDPQPRFTMQMYISQAETASELLRPQTKESAAVSPRIANMMDEATKVGRNQKVCLYQADGVLHGEGQDLTLPGLKRTSSENGIFRTSIAGTAVFRGDRLVGWRDEDQTRMDVLLTSRVRMGQLIVGMDPSDRDISLQVRDSSASFKPVFGTPLSMQISISANCAVDEENTKQNYLADFGAHGVENMADRAVSTRVGQEIRDVQTGFGCDIFGFGNAVYQKDPVLWKKLKPQWRSTFRTMKVSVEATVHLDNSGFMLPKGK